MLRKSLAAGLALASLALPATAGASTASKIKALQKAVSRLQHDLTVVSNRQKTTQARLDGLVGCLVTVPISQYGDATIGYLFGDGIGTSFPTTGIDVDTVTPDAFQMLGLNCSVATSGPRVARIPFAARQASISHGVR